MGRIIVTVASPSSITATTMMPNALRGRHWEKFKVIASLSGQTVFSEVSGKSTHPAMLERAECMKSVFSCISVWNFLAA